MNLFVDTSVWSLAFRRDRPTGDEVQLLARAMDGEHTVVATGLVLQELLEGFFGPKARASILESFGAFPFLEPSRRDHIDAADLRNHCRRNGVQIGTIDSLLAHLCIRHNLVMLSADRDFRHAAQYCRLKVWQA